jgi:acetyl esterase/lipase/nucleoside phosphorylase
MAVTGVSIRGKSYKCRVRGGSYAAYVGRIGGLAVALGVGVALFSHPGIAWAEPAGSSSSGSSSAAPDKADTPAPGNTESPTPAKPSPASSTLESSANTGSTGSTTSESPDAAEGRGGRRTHPKTPTSKLTAPSVPELTSPTSLDTWRPKPDLKARGPLGSKTSSSVTDDSALVSRSVASQKVTFAIPSLSVASSSIDGGAVARAPVADKTPTVERVAPQAPAPADPLRVFAGAVSNLVEHFLNPLAANDIPAGPADGPAAWSVLAFARREFESALAPPALADAAASLATTSQALVAETTDLQAQAVQNSLTYTAPPNLIDQVVQLGLKTARQVFGLFGIDFSGLVGTVLSSEDPPFFLTLGLTAQQTQYEISPGVVWKVWQFEPPNPTGKTVIALHGGGYILQPTLLHWIDYTQMARGTGATVIVPIYPLATTEAGSIRNVQPETADFISQQIDRYGAENVSIYADSAGVTYAMGAVRELILRGDPLPARMVLLSGAADSSLTNPDIKTIDDPIFDVNNLSFYQNDNHTFDGITDLKDPRVSPLFMETDVLKALPPTTIYVGEREILYPDNLLLYQRAVDIGAPISMVVGTGLPHDWPITNLGGTYSQSSVVRPDIYRQLGLLDQSSALAVNQATVADAQPEQRTLILSAFPAEADAVLARTTLDPNPVVVVDGHHFYLGTLGGQKVIVAMTGIGEVNATQTTETALDYFTAESGTSIDAVVFSGVAGGSGRTEIGDVAVPARWTSDGGATWHAVDSEMLAEANALDVDLMSTDSIGDPACHCGPLGRLQLVNLGREPELFVGGDGSTGDNNNGTAFPNIPLGGAVFGPQPLAAPDRSPLFVGNFFQAIVPFVLGGLLTNLTGLLGATPLAVDAVDQETAAAQQVADAHGIPFLGIRGMSDGPGDPLNLPGYPFTFFVYKQIAADNAAIVTEAFLSNRDDDA